jgi:hypothetical protein
LEYQIYPDKYRCIQINPNVSGYRHIGYILYVSRYIWMYPDTSGYFPDVSGCIPDISGYIPDISIHICIYLYPDTFRFTWIYLGFHGWGVLNIT